jgi:hypothetical protein
MHKAPQFLRYIVAGCLVAWLATGVQALCAGDVSTAKSVKLPFTVYDEKGGTNNHYQPSGWMGNAAATTMDPGCTNNPHGGKTCLRCEYSAPAEWAGIVWQDPANDWGDQPGGYDLTGARKLTFWARGEKGDEIITFKFGILGTDKKYSDSATGESGAVKLTREWTEYAIDLEGKDLTHIKTGFVWTLTGQGQPVAFYLDDIRFE